eukprot:CAMPEP_0180694204 /NCGR_PEP_ID=MMETSP1038_2-20121128/1779_1 /TAXON_ID=632150 /ORGANISM="Azadinium spinosum, Strain 3D9" /LENGTH=100 /DNA_ID=CAMNT_0022725517 /DNA_START=2438 /DNA_END=2739 /DNA_ORIENTATION=+
MTEMGQRKMVMVRGAVGKAVSGEVARRQERRRYHDQEEPTNDGRAAVEGEVTTWQMGREEEVEEVQDDQDQDHQPSTVDRESSALSQEAQTLIAAAEVGP